MGDGAQAEAVKAVAICAMPSLSAISDTNASGLFCRNLSQCLCLSVGDTRLQLSTRSSQTLCCIGTTALRMTFTFESLITASR